MFRQIELVIMPKLPLEEVMQNWGEICLLLAERDRIRKHQVPKVFFKTKTS